MKNGTFKKLLAMVLAMSFLLSLGFTAAFADGEGDEGVEETVISHVAVQEDDIVVCANPGGNISVEQSDNTFTISNGNGTEIPESGHVQIEYNNNNPVTVNIESSLEKDVYVANDGHAVLDIDTKNSPDQVKVNMNNDASVTVENGAKPIGISANRDVDGSTEVNANDVTVITGKTEYGAGTGVPNSYSAYGVFAAGNGVTVNADKVTVTADVISYIPDPSYLEDGDANQYIGIKGMNNATVNADSVTSTSENGNALAIKATNGATINVAESVTATTTNGTATAILANRSSQVDASDVNAEAKGEGKAVGIEADKSAVVTANSLTVTSESGGSIAISIVPDKGMNNMPDPTTVKVKEDVASSDIGVEVKQNELFDDGLAVVEIEGTLKVAEGGTPVLLGQGITENNVEITVWKVEIDGEQAKEGQIVKAAGLNPSEEQKAAAKAVEESIQYIIQIKPEQVDNIKSSKSTAKANETFTVTVTPPDGKELDAVYTDEGQKLEATRNADGTYSVTVRVGGGMLLSATFSDKPAVPHIPDLTNTGGTVKLIPELNAHVLYLINKFRTMTFVRGTLEGFQKYSDKLVIHTSEGYYEISLTELLNFNLKGVNFRIVITDTALEIYVNGELFLSIPLSELKPLT